jgi:aldehyde dehydrogenase (NAD+)
MIDGQILIAGAWRESLGGATIAAINPSDGDRFGSLARGTSEDVDAAVRAARAALEGEWGRMPAFERGRVLARLCRLVLDHADELADLEARDVGKPLRQAKADALALARHLEFYAGAADKVHGATIPYQAGYTVMTLREPHGVTGHIIPWNDPMQVLGRSIGAALAMGNAAVLKPSEDASMSALMVGKLALEGACRRACSTSSPAMARRWALRSPRIPASTTSRSRARSRPAGWCSRPRPRTAVRSRSSLAASRRRSCSRMPISTLRCR